MAEDMRYVKVLGRKMYMRNLTQLQREVTSIQGNYFFMGGTRYPIYDDGAGTKVEGPEVDFDKAARVNPEAEWTDDDRSLWK